MRRRGGEMIATGRSSAVAVVLVIMCALTAGRSGAPVEAASQPTDSPSPTPELQVATVQDVLRVVRLPGAKAVVVNVWATWCVPCRQELPDLLRVEREYRGRGLRLVLVSADFDTAAGEARAFLARNGVDFKTYLKTGDDAAFIDGLSPKWSGALPATFVFDGAGALRDFWEGKATYETFAARVRAVIGASSAGGTRR